MIKHFIGFCSDGRRSNERLKVVRTKIEDAYARFGAMYLDNISVIPATASYGQAKVVADALIKRGDKDAFFFGRELKGLANI